MLLCSLSQIYAVDKEDWRVTTCILDKHVHHCLVQEIAYPLKSAVDEKEYIQVLRDVLVGAFILFLLS